ncbi:MAG: L-threonylcarbamoyladenylate synthase [Chloroflexota bacterium]
MTRTRIMADDEVGRAEALRILHAGGIVAIPTDTVYGIAVSPDTPDGIAQLFKIKRRAPDRQIALLVANQGQVSVAAVPNEASEILAAAFWPGPLTLVLPGRDGAGTIGLRLPDHACPRALAAALGPLPTTSANLSGLPDSLNAAAVTAALDGEIDLILDGGHTPGAVTSTVVDCTVAPPTVLREGVLGSERVRAALAAGTGRPGRGTPR